MIVVLASFDGGSVAPTVSDTAGLTWTEEYGGTSGLGGYCGSDYVFYAKPGKLLTSDKVTASRIPAVYAAVYVLAVTNAVAFDPNSGLPSTALSGGTSVSTIYSTSDAQDLIFAIGTSCHSAGTEGWASTFTGLADAFPSADGYKIASTAQSSATGTFTWGSQVGIAVGAVTDT